jgi:hypothetical protein
VFPHLFRHAIEIDESIDCDKTTMSSKKAVANIEVKSEPVTTLEPNKHSGVKGSCDKIRDV